MFHWLYHAMLMYVGIYPLFGGMMWIITALFYWKKHEKKRSYTKLKHYPKVSVVIAAHNEEKDIATAIDSIHALNYPNFEIVIVDDGSSDNTLNVLKTYVDRNIIRLIHIGKNQGKAMAINDALMCLQGEFIFVMDADAETIPDLLLHVMPHFENPNVAAVAGHPRVKNTKNFLTHMEAIEYTSIIGMIRRAQHIWGSIMAVSGVAFVVRKSSFFDVDAFTPNAATEDIDLTWKLQRNGWDVVYDTNAIVWVKVPTSYRAFIKQRLRWARGLLHVMRRNATCIFKYSQRKLWPVFIENSLSMLWVISLITTLSIWVVMSLYTYHMLRNSSNFVPHVWGVIIASVTIMLCSIAHLLDRKYDSRVLFSWPYTIFYAIYYCVILSFISACALPALFIKPKNKVTWIAER
jgi:biofilm PGA synthesis N-glycosyltransferase PgaC